MGSQNDLPLWWIFHIFFLGYWRVAILSTAHLSMVLTTWGDGDVSSGCGQRWAGGRFAPSQVRNFGDHKCQEFPTPATWLTGKSLVSHISLLKLGLAEVLKSPWKFFVSSSVYCGGWWGAGASIWLVLLTNLKQCCSTPLGWQCGSWSSGKQIRTKFEWLRSAAWFYNVLLRLWKDLWLENFALGKNQQHHSGRLFHYRSISAFLSDVAMSATKEDAEWIWKTRSLSAIPRCGGITTEIWAAQAEVTYLGPGMVARGPPVRINQAQGWAHSSTLETLRD